MTQTIRSFSGRVGLYLSLAILASAVFVQSAFAAASPTTGVDYVADLVTPVKSELTLAIVAGLALLVVIIALRVGIKMVRSFGR